MITGFIPSDTANVCMVLHWTRLCIFYFCLEIFSGIWKKYPQNNIQSLWHYPVLPIFTIRKCKFCLCLLEVVWRGIQGVFNLFKVCKWAQSGALRHGTTLFNWFASRIRDLVLHQTRLVADLYSHSQTSMGLAHVSLVHPVRIASVQVFWGCTFAQ